MSSLAGRYNNPITPRFLNPIECLKIPAQFLYHSLLWAKQMRCFIYLHQLTIVPTLSLKFPAQDQTKFTIFIFYFFQLEEPIINRYTDGIGMWPKPATPPCEREYRNQWGALFPCSLHLFKFFSLKTHLLWVCRSSSGRGDRIGGEQWDHVRPSGGVSWSDGPRGRLELQPYTW